MKNFLVVDDDKLVRDSIEEMLLTNHYNVDLANDGNQAINMFKKKDYDVVITDIIMPEKEGFETISELRKINEHIKIIAISGGARNGIGSYLPVAENLGAKAILYKPFNQNELMSTINKICSH